jgi:LPS-assembly lipoprotein
MMRWVLAAILLALSACGFKPSNVLAISEVTVPFSVSSADPYSSLADNIERALTASGASLAKAGEPAISIVISKEESQTGPLALNQFAQVTEYETRYKVTYSLTNELGQVLVDKQDVEFRRVYTYDINSSEGSPAQLELLKREMQAEMIRAILRRANVVLKTKTK